MATAIPIYYLVPKLVSTRSAAEQIRIQAHLEKCNSLDFSETIMMTAGAIDELVCKANWLEIKGANEMIQEKITRACSRRQLRL